MAVKPGSQQISAFVIPDARDSSISKEIEEIWEDRRLGDLAEIKSGGTPRTTVPEYWDGNIPWCTPTDITATPGKWLANTARNITRAGLHACGASILPQGTLLLCSRATIGELKIAMTPMATNQGFKSLVCQPFVDHEFIYYRLLTLKQQMLGLATGSTFLEISKRNVANIQVSVPPLHEQRAIAAALSDVDMLLDGLDRLIAKKRNIKQATMQRLLTGQTRLPGFHAVWERTQLGEVGDFLKGSGVKRDDAQSGTLACVRYGEIYTTHHDYVRRFHSRISSKVAAMATRLEFGDLLFAGSGETREEIGKCVALVSKSEAYAGGDIVILRPRNVDPLFFGYALNMPTVARQKASLGQGDAVVHISAAALAQISLDIPSIEEQTAIATVLYDMDAEIVVLEARRDKTRDLKQAMMQELLTGKTRLVQREVAHA